jgi:hypothetical protein
MVKGSGWGTSPTWYLDHAHAPWLPRSLRVELGRAR